MNKKLLKILLAARDNCDNVAIMGIGVIEIVKTQIGEAIKEVEKETFSNE